MDIKQHIEEINERFNTYVDQLGAELTDQQYQEAEEARVTALQRAVMVYLQELESSGAECPKLVDIVQLFGEVDPVLMQLAEIVDRLSDDEVDATLGLIRDAMSIAMRYGEAAAVRYIDAAVEAVSGNTTDVDQINAELAEAAAEDNAARQIDPAAQAVYSTEYAKDQDAGEAYNVTSAEALNYEVDEIVNRLIDLFPDINVNQSYTKAGTHVNISFFVKA